MLRRVIVNIQSYTVKYNYRLAVRCNIKPAIGRVGKIAQRFHAPAICRGQSHAGGLQSAAGAEIPFTMCWIIVAHIRKQGSNIILLGLPAVIRSI